MVQLQRDFNFGQPFSMEQYEVHVDSRACLKWLSLGACVSEKRSVSRYMLGRLEPALVYDIEICTISMLSRHLLRSRACPSQEYLEPLTSMGFSRVSALEGLLVSSAGERAPNIESALEVARAQ